MHQHVIDLVLGPDSSEKAAKIKGILKQKAVEVAEAIKTLGMAGRKILVAGCGTDFDECCLPLVNALREQGVLVQTRCYWVQFDAEADAFGRDIALVSQEYSEGLDVYDMAVLVTTAIPSEAFLRALIVRMIEFETVKEIEVVPFYVAEAVLPAVARDYSGVALNSDHAQFLVDGRPATSFYSRLSNSIARQRRYFRHMPESIEATLTGRDYEPGSSLDMI